MRTPIIQPIIQLFTYHLTKPANPPFRILSDRSRSFSENRGSRVAEHSTAAEYNNTNGIIERRGQKREKNHLLRR
jgi:hypothetical protein